MKPDGGLSFHILRHCLEKILAEDLDALLAMGFSFEDLRTMEALSYKELAHLSRLGPRFLRITLDTGGFAIALRHIQQETERAFFPEIEMAIDDWRLPLLLAWMVLLPIPLPAQEAGDPMRTARYSTLALGPTAAQADPLQATLTRRFAGHERGPRPIERG